jgi:ribonuclease HI
VENALFDPKEGRRVTLATMYCDGSGTGRIGVVLEVEGQPTKRISEQTPAATSNEAEYLALIVGLRAAPQDCTLTIYTDSKLVVEQVNGRWDARRPVIKKLCGYAKRLIEQRSGRTELKHIRREMNEEADGLASLRPIQAGC